MDGRAIPSVDAVLSSPEVSALCDRYPRTLVTTAVRSAVSALRADLRRHTVVLPPERFGAAAIAATAREWLADAAAMGIVPAINATGIVLHTNLGRAPLAAAAVAAVATAAAAPCALEMDLESGERGERDDLVVEALRALTGAEDALVVNNNAAALLLVLDTLATRREVLVSRGELIEIGGAFRLPDVLAKSGATLREVGTTNRTHLEDFAAALSRRVGLILRTHPSNYRIEGFTTRPDLAQLCALAREHGVPVVEDLGSGALVDVERLGMRHEPTPGESLRAGVDLVTFSGDKLLGGPQAGIVVGRTDLVARLRRNPLKRALRVDKLTLAALRATLALLRTSQDPFAEIPALRLLGRSSECLRALADEAAALLGRMLGPSFVLEIVPSRAAVGSGAQPTELLPSFAVAVARNGWPVERVAASFRAARPAILGRIEQERFLLDLRAVERAWDLVPRDGEGGLGGAFR
jgi:L-seryl-tRNA(Ser) seleniumtransferase